MAAGAEFAARDEVRSREAAGHEPRHRIEIEGNANEETRHAAVYSAVLGCSRAACDSFDTLQNLSERK